MVLILLRMSEAKQTSAESDQQTIYGIPAADTADAAVLQDNQFSRLPAPTKRLGYRQVGSLENLCSRDASSQVIGGPATGRTIGGGAIGAGCECVAASSQDDSLFATLSSVCSLAQHGL